MIHAPITLLALSKDQCIENAGHFFGLVPWYKYLPADHFEGNCGLKKFTILPGSGQSSDVPLIMLAVVDDLLRIAGIVAIAYVIVGAIRYTASQGNPEDTAKAQSTIVNALIGLAIAVVAAAFVGFLGNRLGG